MAAGRQVEAWLHAVFAKDRDNGEWFRSTPELRAFIATLPLIPIAEIKRQKRPVVAPRKEIMMLLDEEKRLGVLEPEDDNRPDPNKLLEEVERRLREVERERRNRDKPPQDRNSAAVALGRRGGKARAQKLTPEERSESARKAGLAGGRGRKKA
jgi:hypothetical protein